MIWIISGVAFLAVFSMVMAIYSFMSHRGNTPKGDENRRLRDLAQNQSSSEAQVRALLRDQSLSTIPLLDRILGGFPKLADLQLLLRQSGVKINLGVLVLLCGTLAALGLLAGAVAGRMVLALILAAVGVYLPIMWLKIMRKRRLGAFEEQFPEAIELMARALRAGHSFTSAMSMVSEELEDPVATEFAQVFEDYSFGRPLGDALDNLVHRIGLQDVKFFATAVMLQRETGGNLTEILDNMGYIIRERFRLMRQVKALSAEGRLSAFILCLMPPALLLVLMAVSPGYIQMLFDHPTGNMLLYIGGTFQLLGIVVVRRLVTLKV